MSANDYWGGVIAVAICGLIGLLFAGLNYVMEGDKTSARIFVGSIFALPVAALVWPLTFLVICIAVIGSVGYVVVNAVRDAIGRSEE